MGTGLKELTKIFNDCVKQYLFDHYEEYISGRFDGDKVKLKAYENMEAEAAIEEEKWALAHSYYYM